MDTISKYRRIKRRISALLCRFNSHKWGPWKEAYSYRSSTRNCRRPECWAYQER